MEKFIYFFKIIAWVIAVTSTLMWIFTLINSIKYPGSIEEILDRSQGKIAVFNLWRPFILAVISWAFVIAF